MARPTLKEALIDLEPELVAAYCKARRSIEIDAMWNRAIENTTGFAVDPKHDADKPRRLSEIAAELAAKISDRQLAMVGREGSPVAAHSAIPLAAWKALRIDNLEAGTVSAGQTVLFDVRLAGALPATKMPSTRLPDDELREFIARLLEPLTVATETLVLEAVRQQFGDRVGRKQVRDCLARDFAHKKLPPGKRSPRPV
jgi:hypothetical protein